MIKTTDSPMEILEINQLFQAIKISQFSNPIPWLLCFRKGTFEPEKN